MKTTLCLVLLCALAPFQDAFGAVCDNAERPLEPSRATSLLAAVQEQYSKTDSFTAKFTQSSFLESLSVSETSEGMVSYLRPGKMRWEYVSPEKQIFVFRESTYWFYQPLDNQVVIDNAGELFLTDLPLSFLLGVGSLSESFSVSRGCVLGEDVALELEGKAGALHENLKRFVLHVTEKTNFPSGADVVDVSGNKTSIRLSDIDRDVSFTDDPFEIAFPSGVDIQDRRKG
ncbi:MAG: outer membrane lipoprotein carrier protein LolA [Bdellovibrionales bacterium]|nr:outer membrane lipoprotein carrier protein LolA [Bdellovibrionales bacterium]